MPVRTALRPSRLILAMVISAALLGASVAAALPSRYDLVVVEFTGDGYSSAHNGDFSDFGAGAFWEEVTAVADTEHTPMQMVQPDEVDSLFGISVRSIGGLNPCQSQYQLLQALHPGTGTAAGVRFWTHIDWPSNLGPDPGKDGVLVTAAPYFGDFERVSGNCVAGNGPLSSLNTEFTKNAVCVVQPDGECGDTIRVPKHTETCGVRCSTTTAGVMNMKVKRFGLNPSLDPIPLLLHDAFLPVLPYVEQIPMRFPVGPPPPPPIIIKKPPEGGTLEEMVYIAKQQPVLKLKGKLQKGVAARVSASLGAAGVAALQHITVPTQLTAVVSFTPVGKRPESTTFPFYAVPKAKQAAHVGTSQASITSVAFGGTATNPTFVVHGKNLGPKPAASPAGHPSGQGGCPVIAGDNGYDYGTSLYVMSSKGWSGGRYRPSVRELDCIDLVVTKFTSTEVDFHFGPFYSKFASKFPLATGDELQVVVNGATKTVTR